MCDLPKHDRFFQFCYCLLQLQTDLQFCNNLLQNWQVNMVSWLRDRPRKSNCSTSCWTISLSIGFRPLGTPYSDQVLTSTTEILNNKSLAKMRGGIILSLSFHFYFFFFRPWSPFTISSRPSFPPGKDLSKSLRNDVS